MRNLTVNEINAISGAGYAEDIVAAAATLYVGKSIGMFAFGFTKAAVLLAVSPVNAPLAALAGGAMLISAPIAVGAYVLQQNPGMQEALSEQFHTYFG